MPCAPHASSEARPTTRTQGEAHLPDTPIHERKQRGTTATSATATATLTRPRCHHHHALQRVTRHQASSGARGGQGSAARRRRVGALATCTQGVQERLQSAARFPLFLLHHRRLAPRTNTWPLLDDERGRGRRVAKVPQQDTHPRRHPARHSLYRLLFTPLCHAVLCVAQD